MTDFSPADVEAAHEYLTTREVAMRLRVSARTLERHRMRGTGALYSRIGGRVIYRWSDVRAWVVAARRDCTSGTPQAEGAA